MKRVEIMIGQIELVRNKLEKLVAVTESLVDGEVISLSQELDKLIFQYYEKLYPSINKTFYNI
ncbi:aspartyl-phosphate phosphatase Spo0E family protein [Clostridium tagluense]|uniref:aspartyl-phosphate phosphatase Spo0E family protein n=2 Tax=Clostridium tagluense TaxID=360422 RepID=UPI001C6F0BE5|nr:aspartyl-phosphate phosphatase Spo0E family protein [Clostridium tagluense]MBW9157227.1 aspartyl-phosphate phosphatase Spo0E family protein [Clostridium tagluense]WLC67173.1 aspartyl-phosphate phosphatase Spo0E family protein [Clostridium tagluense]